MTEAAENIEKWNSLESMTDVDTCDLILIGGPDKL